MKKLSILILTLLGITTTNGVITLPNIITSNFVLQGEKTARVWGTSTCSSVEVLLKRQDDNTIVRGGSVNTLVDGSWVFEMENLPISTDYHYIDMTDCGGTVSVYNVYIGEVFICSGQSNMEWGMRDSNGGSSVSMGLYPHLRVYTAERLERNTEQLNINSRESVRWSSSESSNAGAKTANAYPSAVCYFMAQYIYDVFEGTVPIGIVSASRGGAKIQQFMSPTARVDTTCGGAVNVINSITYDSDPFNVDNSVFWYGMLEPFLTMGMRSFIWYQGEGDSTLPDYYACAINSFVADVRTRNNDPYLPFYSVGLAGYNADADWGKMRESMKTPLVVGGYFTYITNADLGDRGDIHPVHKQDTGHRLASAILYQEFEKDVAPFGPNFIWDTEANKFTYATLNGKQYLRLYFENSKAMYFGGTKDCNTCCDTDSPFVIYSDIQSKWLRVPVADTIIETPYVYIDYQATTNVASTSNTVGLRIMYENFPQCALYSDFGCFTKEIAGESFTYPNPYNVGANIA